jgi:hypothetical protein
MVSFSLLFVSARGYAACASAAWTKGDGVEKEVKISTNFFINNLFFFELREKNVLLKCRRSVCLFV